MVRPEFADIDVAIFAAHRRFYGDLAVCNGRLVPQSEDLRLRMSRRNKEPVFAPDYDRDLLCGTDYSLYYAMQKLMSFRSEDQRPDNRAPISGACYLLAMTGCLRDTVSMQVARKLRAITARPMIVVPAPRISDATELKLYPKLQKTGDAERIAGYFASASKALCKEVDAEILAQPQQTLRSAQDAGGLCQGRAARVRRDAPAGGSEGLSAHERRIWRAGAARALRDAGLPERDPPILNRI